MTSTQPTVTDRPGETRETTFGDLRIAFDERVLTPRPWTAEQSAWAATLLGDLPTGPVLELCCGAGHIGLLAVQGSDRDLVQVDLNPVACAFARLNADRVRSRGRVEVRNVALHEAARPDEMFAMVIADPPYLPRAEVATYPEDPVLAVDGGEDGMELVGECLETVRRHLLPGGQALLQLRDRDQAEDVRNRLAGGRHGELRLVETRSVRDRGVLCRIGSPGPAEGSVPPSASPGSLRT